MKDLIKNISVDLMMNDRGAFYFEAQTRELMIEKGIALIYTATNSSYLTMRALKIDLGGFNYDDVFRLQDELIDWFKKQMANSVYVVHSGGYQVKYFDDIGAESE